MSFIKNILKLCSASDRWHLLLLLGVMCITALFEVAGVASIMPFMAILSNPEALATSVMFQNMLGVIRQVLHVTIDEDTTSLVRLSGLITLAMLLLSNGFALLTNWLLLRFSYQQSHRTACRLLQHYLRQPYAFFLNRNSADLSKNILAEVHRINVAVVIPTMQLFAKTLVVCAVVALLLAINPMLAFTAALTIGSIYALIFIVIRRRLNQLGKASTRAESERFKSATEAFGGIKEIKVSGRYEWFENRFIRASATYAHCHSNADAMSLLPKYILEIIAFGGLVIIALFLLQDSAAQGEVLPLIALYAFAGYRLIPAMQQIYSSVVLTRYHGAAFHHIVSELAGVETPSESAETPPPIAVNDAISVQHVSFAYDAHTPVLNDVNIEIPARKTLGMAGLSGAGKSTLADILLGLLIPTSGNIVVDGTTLDAGNLHAWRMGIGYVPQSIYLTDDTMAANIAFGISAEAMDRAQIEQAARRAHLHEFISSLPEGYDTVVGEKGVRLSGGQRQRIGIARALYHQPSVLILDEATSALDNITEHGVMEAIGEISGSMTIIIIAHRLSTLKGCDTIVLMEQGRVAATGSYADLLTHSPAFKALAQKADHGDKMLDHFANEAR